MNVINYVNSDKQFYPTPKALLDSILEDINWRKISTVLEPSAGKGDILDYIKEKAAAYPYYNARMECDCIEVDENLRKILKGKEYSVIYDDFLTYDSMKQYDLIIMNPPFKDGAKHLLHAIETQKNGGYIICILNSETLKNPYSNERKDLVSKLDKLNASITYHLESFSSSERETDVEVAVVKMDIPKPEMKSKIFEEMRRKYYGNYGDRVSYDAEIVSNDFVEAIILQYNLEVHAGIELIKEYQSMRPELLNSMDKNGSYKAPLIELKVGNSTCLNDAETINKYVELVRMKYWEALFSNKRFTNKMTAAQRKSYLAKVNELKVFDFNNYNIKTLQIEMCHTMVSGIEECILKLFEEFTYEHCWYDECTNNIHYYNGWSTNKAWIINKKVIIPMNTKDIFGKMNIADYHVKEKFFDMDRALDYLNTGNVPTINSSSALDQAKENEETKKIKLRHFTATFYKKGTCHLEFNDPELLKKLNIFGSQQRGWLPPSYGKKHYKDMSKEEKQIVNEFQGEKDYEFVLHNADEYIYDPKNSVPLLSEKTA